MELLIPELDGEESNNAGGTPALPAPTPATADDNHRRRKPTPLHAAASTPKATPNVIFAAVSCADCRPSPDHSRRLPPPSPRSLLRSVFRSLTVRLPRPAIASSAAPADAGDNGNEEWRLAAEELSRKLLAATRKRDEALLEASKLKYSLAELERKVARLETRLLPSTYADVGGDDDDDGSAPFPTKEAFVSAVASARNAVRVLARSLSANFRNPSPSPSAHVEAFLNRAFYSGFELESDEELGLPDPTARCAANRAAYDLIRRLSWDDVLTKGTRHYSEALSQFCDAKMGDVVRSLGWVPARAWPEPLLQAFFAAARGVWAVRLLARSVHPSLPIVRVDRGAKFDARFMEDVAAARAAMGRLEPSTVKMMLAPGFDVYNCSAGVVKCRVMCFYGSSKDGCRDGRAAAGGGNGGGRIAGGRIADQCSKVVA